MNRVLWFAVVGLAVASPLSAQEPKNPSRKTKAPSKQIAVDLDGGVKLKMVLVPAGEFMMGSGESAEATVAFFKKNYGQSGLTAGFLQGRAPAAPRSDHEAVLPGHVPCHAGPVSPVRQGYRLQDRCRKGESPGANGWDPDKKLFALNAKYSWRNVGFEQTDEHPVVNVSWNDAVAFCKWLSKKEGKTYRLPTEAEWEYACRAGTTTRYSSGDDPETLAKVGNVADAAAKAKLFPHWTEPIKASDGYVFTAPVGKFKPNAFALYDMHGNAWQWCADWYGAEYYAKSPVDDPTGPDSGSNRVLRGGSWYGGPYFACSATRHGYTPILRLYAIGFRVARTQ